MWSRINVYSFEAHEFFSIFYWSVLLNLCLSLFIIVSLALCFPFSFLRRKGGERDNILHSYLDILIFRVLESCFSNVKRIKYLKGCPKGIWICLIKCLNLGSNFNSSSVISLVPCFSRQQLLLCIVFFFVCILK